MNHKKRNPFFEYFANVWAGIVTTYVGMKLTLRYCRVSSVGGKPVTMQYPEEKPAVPETYRGIHAYDEDKCLVCMGCVKACPVDAITIESIGAGRDAMITRFDVDYSKCLFCDLCTGPCPEHCVRLSTQYDLARYTREETIVHFARPKTPEEIAAHQAMLAQKEAEKKAKLEAAKKAKEAEAAAAAAAKKEAEHQA